MKEKDVINLYKAISDNLQVKSIFNAKTKDSIINFILAISLLKNIFEEMDISFLRNTASKEPESETDVYPSSEKTSSLAVCCKGVMEDTLETLNQMALEGHLVKGVDYDLSKKTSDELSLRLNYTSFYKRFINYCREKDVSFNPLPIKTFKKELRKKEYCVFYNKPITFRTKQDSKHFKTFRTAVLSVDKLREMNINIDFLISK
jgi:hypothetical protein